MANTMTGRVLKIGEIEEIPSKNGGEPFRKRTVILNCTRSDFGRVFNNFPSFEFMGRHIDDPLVFKVDDIVTISFALQGTMVQKDGQPEKYFNTISGYKIEHYQRGNGTQRQPAPQAQDVTQPQTQEPQGDDLPF